MNYERTSEFSRDLKHLLRRFRTLEEDLLTAQKNAIELLLEKGMDNNAVEKMPGFCSDTRQAYKLRKFACRALRGHGVMSGIRVTFFHYPSEGRVVYAEMYFKGDKENEDRERLRNTTIS